jgi:hypothetical protein
MTVRQLDYPRDYVRQETGYWCGPASTQTVLYSRGLFVDEGALARQIGTHVGGTDHIGLIVPVLNNRLGADVYRSAVMPNDPPSSEQRDRLWRDIVSSIYRALTA